MGPNHFKVFFLANPAVSHSVPKQLSDIYCKVLVGCLTRRQMRGFAVRTAQRNVLEVFCLAKLEDEKQGKSFTASPKFVSQ